MDEVHGAGAIAGDVVDGNGYTDTLVREYVHLNGHQRSASRGCCTIGDG